MRELEEESARTARFSGFWFVSGLAAFLALLSWLEPALVQWGNAHIFHVAKGASKGWWVYVAVRLALSAVLVSMVVRFPVSAAAKAPAEGRRRASTERWFDPLLGLRAFACFLVMMGHYFMVVLPFTAGRVPGAAAALLRSCPWAGVYLFFTLSGYLMGKGFSSGRYSMDEMGMRSFLRNRILRIAPIYYGSILVINAMRYPAVFAGRNLWALLQTCVFDMNADGPTPTVGALWSVSTEMQFYLLAPVLTLLAIKLARRMGKSFVVLPLLLLAVGTAGRIFIERHVYNMGVYGYSPLIPNLDLFLCGLTLNLLPRWRPASARTRAWLNAALVAGVPLFYVWICYVTSGIGSRMTLPVFWARYPAPVALFAAAFIYLADARGKVQLVPGVGALLLRGVEWMGVLTYCLYVFHSDIFLSLAALLPQVHGLGVSLRMFPMAVAETFTIAAFFYYVVEKPFDAKKKVSGTALLDAP